MAEEKKFRVESDLLGELKVPADALYGVQTQRGINNYHISRKTMRAYPDFIIAIAYVKLAAIETNHTHLWRTAKNLNSNLDLSSDIVYNETRLNQVVILCHLEANRVTFRTQK